MEEFRASKVTYNLQPDLLGSFPADVCPDITGQFGCGHRAQFSPSVGVCVKGGRGPKGEIHPYSRGEGKETSDK